MGPVVQSGSQDADRGRPVAKTRLRNIYPCGDEARNIQSSPRPDPRGRAIRLSSSRIKIAIALWLAAEALAFYLVAELVGYPEALLIGVITTLFGWTLLKRAGASAALKLRAFVDRGRSTPSVPPQFAEETLASLGALALLLPGFLSDGVGLVLAIPAARQRLAGWLGSRRRSPFRPDVESKRRRPDPPTIDLEPGEWRHGDGVRRHPASET